jgi:parvulin-like peptidyl-prolyl isomerase
MRSDHCRGSDGATDRRRLISAILAPALIASLVLPAILALGLLPLSGYSEQAGATVSPETVIASYDGVEITAAEFQKLLRQRATEVGPGVDVMQYKGDILEDDVTRKLLAMEAKKRGFVDEEGMSDPSIVKDKEQVMVNTLRRDVILAGVDVTDGEVWALCEKARERRLTRVIVLGDKEEADEVGRELKSGADFIELAETWSLDLGSATWNAVLGWVKAGDGPVELEDVIYSLPVGEIGGPVESPNGYYYLRVDSIFRDAENPCEKREAAMRTALRRRKYLPVYAAYMDSVAQALGVKYNYDTIDMVVKRFAAEGWVSKDMPGRWAKVPTFSYSEQSQPVFSFNGGSRTLEEYLNYIGDKKINPALYLAGREEMERGLRSFARDDLALYVAYQMGMDKVDVVRGHVREKATEKGVTDMLVEVCGGEESAKPTDEDRRKYYEENIWRYTEPEAAVVQMVTITSEEEANDLYKEAAGGASYEQMVSDYKWVLDEDKTNERLRLTNKNDYPDVFEAARRMKVGDVSEPIATADGGYMVVKLLEKEPGQVLPFDEVKDEVTLDVNMRILNNAYQAMQDFKKDLRERYKYTVNKEALDAVGL